MHEIEWHRETLRLLPERAVHWPAAETLWIADPHFGKDATFRAAGIPVPQAALHDDLERLTRILEQTAARRLIVLGDFWHTRAGRTPSTLAALEQWRDRHADLECILLRGNHDHGAGDPPDAWRIDCHAAFAAAPFRFQHHPPDAPGDATVCGHIHPGCSLANLRMPCFFFGPHLALLPAFGSFTGLHIVRPGPGESVYLVTPEAVVPGPGAARNAC